MGSSKKSSLHVDGHEIQVTRPDKILFPDDGITKADLIHYYEQVGSWILPYLTGRPLTMERYPDGISGPGFLQKAAARYYPAWITTVEVKKTSGTLRQVTCDSAATLVYFANQASITPHVWLSRVGKPEFPDQMILDLDPSTEDLRPVIAGAHLIKDLLDRVGLPAFLKSTGSRGLHIAVPLEGKDDFPSVRALARQLAQAIVDQDPGTYTLEQYKKKRGDRVLIDVNRNGYAQTAVANYAVRARRGAPVALPLAWNELGKKGFRPDGATIGSVLARLEKSEDPWQDFWSRAVSLSQVRGRMEKFRAA